GDFYVEVDAAAEAGPADGMLGILFRYEDIDNFYAFLVSGDGWYTMLKYVDGEMSRPIDWSESTALQTGEGAENKVAVLANGREIAVFANDEELDRAQDGSFATGQIALVAGTNKEGDLEVSFDNFGLWTKAGVGSSEPTVGRKSIKRSTPAPPERPATTPDAVVSSDPLNVRSGPGTNYPVVGILKKGDGVKVVGRSVDSKWAKLGFTDVPEAWASAQYLAFNTDFAQAPVAKAPPAPAPPPKAPTQPAKKNVAWLVVENHIGRYITLQVNDQNYRVEGKVGDTPGRFQFELQGVGRYRVAAQLPNGGSHNWDLYVEPTPDKCLNRQGCVALGQTFLQTYY
ncbi:MAG: SH3 domain-containing protein, partial [Nitrososphaerales archaeon]